ncbi:MAG: PIG-L family deacetylase, partial [Gemmataceae bacterium]|nr:PIG-L family deacetylase [Gemmataceae bacterium]
MSNKGCNRNRRTLMGAITVVMTLLVVALVTASYQGAGQRGQAAEGQKADAQPKENEKGKPKKPRVLVIVAHADDMEYDMGGFVAQLVDEGHEVYRVAVTDSARGTFDRSMTIEKMKKIGEDEAEAAGKVLGLKGNLFLGFPDSFIQPHEFAIAEKLMQVIRRLKPGIVILFDPWATQDDHPDHAVVARAAYWASEFAPFPLFHPDQLKEEG